MHFPDVIALIQGGIFYLRHGFSRNWYWNFNSTAAQKMYKPFLYYKNHLHGYPCQHSFKDSVYPEIRVFFNECTKEDWENPNNKNISQASQKAWTWVLGEIEFALKFEYDDEIANHIEVHNPDYDKKYTTEIDGQIKKELTYLEWQKAKKDPRYGNTKYDPEASAENRKRAMRGFELMGKYWMNLWD